MRQCLKFLNFRKKGRISDGDRRVNVAVAGACSAAGSTHLAIMTANFYANVCGLRTVIVDCTNQKDFIKICYETDRGPDDYREFAYRNIAFVTGEENLTGRKVFERAAIVVYDCGCAGIGSKEFRLADVRIAVLSASVYKVARSERFIDEMKTACVYTCAFGGDRQLDALSRKAGIPVARIPYEKDPFVLSSASVGWLSNLLEKAVHR